MVEEESNKNGTEIPITVTNNIIMTAIVSCTKPAVNLTWRGPGTINNKTTPCEDNVYFTSESELSIDSATEDQNGRMVSLQVSHPLLSEIYCYELKVYGRYMMLSAILKEVLRLGERVLE